ncbi:MAG: class I SAM-dependent methyltransferase [Maribacter sp.]|nr:class I SAM-dependent methyltransferase [Maribacter sp.]
MELKEFYSQFHKDQSAGGYYDEVEDRMQSDFPQKIRSIQFHLGHNKFSLLDVGCGKGYFVKACRDFGISATGIDRSDTGIRFASEQLGLNLTCGDLHSHKDTLSEQYDVVTFWATIEHLSDPEQMLEDIMTVLKPGGYVFLDTGIGNDWLDHLLPGRVQWFDPPQHLFVFSINGIRKLFDNLHYEVVHIDKYYERTYIRRWMKIVHNLIACIALGSVSKALFLHQNIFEFRRYPLGNLMSIVARKPNI